MKARWAGAIVFASGLLACGGPAPHPSSPASAPAPSLGRTTSFALPSDDGVLVPIPQPSAKVTVVDAFAPRGAPCAKKVPALLAQKDALEGGGARLVLVAVLADGESDDDAAAALKKWGAESPFLVDRGDVLRRELGVDKLPSTVVLDAKGTVRWVATPDASADDVVAAARSAADGR